MSLLILFGLLVALVNPRGFIGGGYDDGRYLAAATRWALDGPILGENHWALRWPVILPTAGILRLFGPNANALMIPGLLSYLALGLVNYLGVRSAAGERAAFLAGFGIMATPGIAYWATAIYPDLLEAVLWSAAFWSLWQAARAADEGGRLRWLATAGLIAGFSICVRETSIALAFGLIGAALLLLPRLPLKAWIIAAGCAAILPVGEYAILWAASGDPIYRLHVDLRHIAIPTEDMRGGTATGQLAVLNAGIMERWSGAGPVHIHWLVDTYINFFLNFYYGFAYVALAGLAIWQRRQRRTAGSFVPVKAPATQGLVPALLLVAGANIVWNLYVLALNPSDRMFIPATTMVAICVAIFADRLWPVRSVRITVALLMAVKALSTLIVADTLPNYRYTPAVAQRVASAEGPVHVSWQTHSNMALADPALRARLDLSPTPVGGYLMVYTSIRAPYVERVLPGRWRLIRSGVTGRVPYTARSLNGLLSALGGPSDLIKHADVEVRLFQRVAGPAGDAPVIVDARGRALPPEARPAN
ncbi:MAG: glycosyltransferase family 39 protein [Sphingobium sp.]